MTDQAMEQLVEQVPELNLRKRTETRTVHWTDVRENKNLREGDVIPMISWVDDAGYQWTHADVMLYIKTLHTYDKHIESLDAFIMSVRKTVKMEVVH